MTAPPPSTVQAAIAEARAQERARCIAFLRGGPFPTAATLLAVWAEGLAAGPPGAEGADIEARIRADERRGCAAALRDQAAVMRQRGELIASSTASYLSGLIDPLGPVMGAPAAGGFT